MGDRLFRGVLLAAATATVLVIIGLAATLLASSLPSIRQFGFGYLLSQTWDPVKADFGALTFIVGTLLTSGVALLLSLPFSLAVGLLLGEYYTEGRASRFMGTLVDLLAAIPSVVYGMWGLVVVVPLVRNLEALVHVPPYGTGIFTSSILLAIMIIPYSSSITTEVLKLVPEELKHAGYGVGGTRFEVVRSVIIPYARSGILAGIMLAFGRALGETMAVTLVIGNVSRMPTSVFSLGNTLASVIASQFTEAATETHRAALIELGLLLFVITTLINVAGRVVIDRLGGHRA
jgi:phosphate transport system permease protein